MNLDVYKIQYCTVQDVFQRAISIVFSFIKVKIYMNKTLSGRLRELKKQKGKVQLGDSKSGCDRLRKRSLTKAFHYKFQSRVKGGFTKVVVTRTGRLREWS